MKLQTVREFVKRGIGTDFLMVQEYTYFLDWALTLDMFIPCDVNDIPLTKPEVKFKSPYPENNLGSYHCGYCGFRTGFTPTAIQHQCVDSEYRKQVDLLVFKGFKIERSNYGNDTMVIRNDDGCKLEFNTQYGTIWDISYDQPTEIKIVSDLMIHEPVLNYAW